MNIEDVQKYGLCSQCGTCAGLCPKENISVRRNEDGMYLFRIEDASKCGNCSGICKRVCPGYEVDFHALNQKQFGRLPGPAEDWIGHCISAYLAHSLDEEVLSVASAGGIVTQLSVYLLESGTVDGILSVRVGGATGMVPELYVARTREEVLKAAQSKYFPIPKNELLRQVLRTEEKYALVAVPCQVQGLLKGQEIYSSLKVRIPLIIGLFCGRCASYRSARFIMEKAGYADKEVEVLTHRHGTPSRYHLRLRDGREIDIPQYEIIGFGGLLFLDSYRCLLCPDRLNELSDISVGDAGKGTSEGPALNSILARSDYGAQVMRDFIAHGPVYARQVEAQEAVAPQRFGLINQKRGSTARRKLASLLPGLHAPAIKVRQSSRNVPIPLDYAAGLLQITIVTITRRKWIYRIMRHIPFAFFRKLCRTVYHFSIKPGK